MPKGIKQIPAKRKYTKRAKPISDVQNIKNTDSTNVQFLSPIKDDMDEVAFLDLVVQQLDNMDANQKGRFLNYIHSRFYQYFGFANIVNP